MQICISILSYEPDMEAKNSFTRTVQLDNGDKITVDTSSGNVVRVGKDGNTFLMNDFIRLTDEFEHGLAG